MVKCVYFGTSNLDLAEEKSAKVVKIQASNNDENITRKPFSEWWEGLKTEKRVQILHGTPAKMSRKSQL